MMKSFMEEVGQPAMLEQLAEECAELSQAALKMARKLRGENPTPLTEEVCLANLTEEIADVQWCIDQLGDMVDSTAVETAADYKQQRACKRLGLSSQDDSDHLGQKVKMNGFLC